MGAQNSVRYGRSTQLSDIELPMEKEKASKTKLKRSSGELFWKSKISTPCFDLACWCWKTTVVKIREPFISPLANQLCHCYFVYPRDPPPGNGRPHYISQLSDIGFIGKVYSLMVTSSHIWLISPILNVPNLKVIFLVENTTLLSKQTKRFCPLLLSFCKSGGTRCPCFVFTSISLSYLTSIKPNVILITQQPSLTGGRPLSRSNRRY